MTDEDLLDLWLSKDAPDRREPTAGEHACAVCGAAATFGDGPNWFCRAHLPADFWSLRDR